MTGKGWIKLHRELTDKAIWLDSTPEQKTILITLLTMANHEENEWIWKGEKYKVKKGQFITSLDSITKKCGKGVSVQNVRTALKRFEKYEFLTNESTNKNRLITIVNWGSYQGKEENQQANQQATNKQLTTNKNDKNEKNIKNIVDSDFSDEEQLKSDFEKIYSIYPKKTTKASAFSNYKKWLKGKQVDGKKIKLNNKQIYIGVYKYVKQQDNIGAELKFYKNFSTLMGNQLLDFVPSDEEMRQYDD